MNVRRLPYILLISLLIFSIIPSQALTGKQNVVLRTSSNNIAFTLGNDLTFHRIVVNSTQLRLDQSYSSKKHTRYSLYVLSPSNVNLTVNSWFPTGNSSATLTISAPSSTNLALGFYSPEMITARIRTGESVSQTYTSANKTLNFVVNTDTSSSFTIEATVTEADDTNYTPENADFEITDHEGDRWVFSEAEYYTFKSSYWDGNGWSDLDTVSLGFTDGVNQVNVSYDVSSGIFNLTNGGNIVILREGTVSTQDSNLLVVNFRFRFRNTVIDVLSVDVWMFCNDTDSSSPGWENRKPNYFHIMNLGGAAMITTGGDGESGRVQGGDVFDLFVITNDSGTTFAESTATFRNLQHIKLLPRVNFIRQSNEPTPYFTLTYGVEYFVNGEWVDGFSVKIKEDIQAAGSNRWFNWTTEFYQGSTLVKSDRWYLYFLADSVTPSTDENSTGVFWVDMWFNKINASSIGGIRVNAYQYPMSDASNEWLRWLTGSNWGIREDLEKQQMSFTNLLDADGNIIHTQQISLVNITCRLEIELAAGRGTNLTAVVGEYDIFDLTFGTDPFTGVQTPPFEETRVPYLPQGGLIGVLWSGLMYVAKVLSDALGPALLNFFDAFVGFLDSVAAFFGAPGLFSAILTFFQSAWVWFTNSVTWILSLLGTMFLALIATMGKFVNFVASVVAQWVGMFQIFINFLDGTYTAGVNFWTDFSIGTWILLAAILYPLYLLELAATKGIDSAINNVMFLVNIGAFLVNGLIVVVQLIINLISSVVEAIPVVE